MDDILLFGQVSLRELKGYKEILDIYHGATCVETTMRKFGILFNNLGDEIEG